MSALQILIDNARTNINDEAEKVATEAVEEIFREIAAVEHQLRHWEKERVTLEEQINSIQRDPAGFQEDTYGKHAHHVVYNKIR